MKAKICLIHGKKNHGKDYLALQMKDELEKNGFKVDVFSFADPVKEILCDSLSIDLDFFNDIKNNKSMIYVEHKGKKIPLVNARSLIQNFGTEAMKKHFGEKVWAKLLIDKVKNSDADIVLVPDFRFKSEIISDITVKITDETKEDSDNHRSENELNDATFKYYIDNNGRKDLSSQVKDLCNTIVSLL